MHQLSPFTCRRLSQLPRLTSVWECDRRPLPTSSKALSDLSEASQGDCILWVDSLQGVVRGLSVVPRETGNEAIVRTLLQAIEAPQGGNGVEPARPRKVVVCDREIQFFLRGALQDLDIPVEHSPTLPVIDEVFQRLQAPEITEHRLPRAFEASLLEKAALMWDAAPWNYLSEQEILAIDLNRWEIKTLYLSVLGLAGLEYGLLFYRDLSSLQQFRRKLLQSDDFSEGMQQAFLEQNCLFINFNPVDDIIAMPIQGVPTAVSSDAVEYDFGSLHPLEGLRSQLAAEEAVSLIVVLEALHRFFKKHDLSTEKFALQPVSSRFHIPNPVRQAMSATRNVNQSSRETANERASEKSAEKSAEKSGHELTPDLIESGPEKVTVKVSTLPEVSAIFLADTHSAVEGSGLEEVGSSLADDLAPLIEDSVPEGSLIMLGSFKDKKLAPLRETERIYYQSFIELPQKRPDTKSDWPTLTIQTTRPKAHQLVERIRKEGGMRSICFNTGHDPLSGQSFQVGLIETRQGHLHLFNEYEVSDAADSYSLEKWAKGSHKNQHCCSCIIATGSTGAQRGRPTDKEVIAFFEVIAKRPQELGLAPLVMSYALD